MLQKVCIDEKNQNRILHYNLQWFAKDGEGGEKTEPATAKKLKDARDEGKVAKSRELNSAFDLIVLFLYFTLVDILKNPSQEFSSRE